MFILKRLFYTQVLNLKFCFAKNFLIKTKNIYWYKEKVLKLKKFNCKTSILKLNAKKNQHQNL